MYLIQAKSKGTSFFTHLKVIYTDSNCLMLFKGVFSFKLCSLYSISMLFDVSCKGTEEIKVTYFLVLQAANGHKKTKQILHAEGYWCKTKLIVFLLVSIFHC